MQVLKIKFPNVGFEPFVPLREGPDFKFPPGFNSSFQGQVFWQDCVPASPPCFDVIFFSFSQYIVIVQLDQVF